MVVGQILLLGIIGQRFRYERGLKIFAKITSVTPGSRDQSVVLKFCYWRQKVGAEV